MSRARAPLLVALGLSVAGCRFGGTAADPYAETPFPADTGGTSGGQGGTTVIIDPGDPGAGGAPSGTGSGGLTATVTDASAGQNSAGGVAPDASPSGGGGTGGTSTGCQPPAPVAVCDPIRNIGCLLPVSFCDIDPTQSAPTGRCVFPPNPPPAGTTCEVTIPSESCPPLSSCVNGACRKLCYCDADCPVAECCTEPAPGPPRAFKVCAPC